MNESDFLVPIPKMVRAYELRTVTDMSYPEIARALEVDPHQLYTDIKRAEDDGLGQRPSTAKRARILTYLRSVWARGGGVTAKQITDATRLTRSEVNMRLQSLVRNRMVKIVDRETRTFKYEISERLMPKNAQRMKTCQTLPPLQFKKLKGI